MVSSLPDSKCMQRDLKSSTVSCVYFPFYSCAAGGGDGGIGPELGGEVSGRIYSNSEITFAQSSRQDAVVLPTICFSAGRAIDNMPFSVRMNVFLNAAFNTLDGGPAPLKERETILHLMPEFRVYYHKGAVVNLYGSVSAGLRIRSFKETLSGDSVSTTDYRFSWQVSPFGMEIGRNVYANMQFGYGWTAGLFALGVGYRF